MPSYDYKCSGCEHSFVKFARVSSRRKPCEAPCESCGEVKVDIVINSAPQPISGHAQNNKIPDGFKDILKTIKKQSGKGCTVDV